jgi:putative transposase
MTYPLVLDLADDGIPVTVTCRVLGFSTQGFYKWCANPASQRDWQDAHLNNATIAVHADDPEFGYRFIADELHAAGHRASENRVQRLCALQRIASSILRKRRGSGKTPGPPVHDDHVNRDFHAETPDQIWLTDISEHPTLEGKLYICAVKDVCSRRIVGYTIDSRMTSHLADAALRTAIARRNPTGTVVVHSDRGGQFQSHRYQRTLWAHGMTGSMGRVSSAGDNACDGVVLRTATEQRPQPADLDDLCCARNSASRSSLGSSGPTTTVDGSAPSASSPRSSTEPSSATTVSPKQHDPHNRRQPKSGQTHVPARSSDSARTGSGLTVVTAALLSRQEALPVVRQDLAGRASHVQGQPT